MRLLRRSGLIFGLGLLAQTAFADVYTDALQKRLAFIFKDEKLDRASMGVEVFSLSRQESLFRLNHDAPLSPASTVKTLTGLVALKKLGPDFTYKTEVYVDGPIEGGVLRGNLWLRGSGDPSLVTETMYILVANVLRSDIREIRGKVMVDDWTFDQVKLDPARIPTNTDRPYNAPIGGMSFNYNTTTVFFRPGESVGRPVRAYVEPDTGYVRVQNRATTSARGGKYALVASREQGKGFNTIVLRGTMPLGMGEQRSFFNITEPNIYAGMALQSMLMEKGVRVPSSEIGHAQVPSGARKIAELESLPLREIVTLMNKFSNNFIADTLVKTLGREQKGVPGTMEKGLQVIREEATRLGLNEMGFRVVSGSGLTRDNRMTANQFVRLLNAAYLDFDVLPELLASLPIAGRDGTLRSRMKGTTASGRLRAKTGSIDGVSALTGVVQSINGELLAFAVLMNDRTQSSAALRPWQNFFGQALADFNRAKPLSERPTAIPNVLEPDLGSSNNRNRPESL